MIGGNPPVADLHHPAGAPGQRGIVRAAAGQWAAALLACVIALLILTVGGPIEGLVHRIFDRNSGGADSGTNTVERGRLGRTRRASRPAVLRSAGTADRCGRDARTPLRRCVIGGNNAVKLP